MPALRPFLIFWLSGSMLVRGADDFQAARAGDLAVRRPSQILTNINQFRALPTQDYLRECPFHLTGTITLVDTNRQLLVLQDATGAIAVNLDMKAVKAVSLEPGQLLFLEGANCSPYFVTFPDFPYRPSGWDIRALFEAPSNWGDYHLTRMRGYLYPPATGDYTFWIASDNSSELWLSPDEDPAKVRKIALVKEGDWVGQHEWFHFPSQRSETILLRAGRTYYIEAFQEQLTEDDNLAVAWQGPGLKQSVIDGRYLAPWVDNRDQSLMTGNSGRGTNGILREYWTNFSAGNLTTLTGPRPFESALTVEGVKAVRLGPGLWPEPRRITLGQELLPEGNYRWVEVEGTVSFMATVGDTATLELDGGQGRAQVRVANCSGKWPHPPQDWRVRVQGVCEGVYGANGQLMPGIIWAPTQQHVSFIEPAKRIWDSSASAAPYYLTPAYTNPTLGGYYFTRGVVTFNDRVFNKDCLFIQDAGASIFVPQVDRSLRAQLQVGIGVELGGNLLPGRYSPALRPTVVAVLGRRFMPEPVTQLADGSAVGIRDGLWTEIKGVVRSVDANGTMVLAGKTGPISIWIGGVTTNALSHYVDATLRARGVMSLEIRDTPLLLVPSRSFVDVEEEAPEDPFAIRASPIAGLNAGGTDLQWVHRVKVAGAVTYRTEQTFFIQDVSGGARVQTRDLNSVQVGDLVEVVGFPEAGGSVHAVTEALVRKVGTGQPLKPRSLDLSKIVAGRDGGTLVQLKANLLTQKTRGSSQVMELQEGQRVFEAVLSRSQGELPHLAAGSLIQVTGVCEVELVASLAAGKTDWENPSVASLQISLRSSRDVVLLGGPPWWTWKEAAALIGMLLTVLMGALLGIYLLRRRLERQQAAQLAFSRQIIQSQERERHRIAANLHDSLGQNLLVIKNQARLAMQPVVNESVLLQRLNEISGMASQAIEEVRQITHDLRPYQLDRLGLTQAIRGILRRVSENCPIVFANHVDEIDGLFDNESEINIYRIVQEGVNNVVKHSGATEATVVVKKQASIVSISIRDNGRGFEMGLTNPGESPGAGFGLTGVSERTRILGGKIVLDSQPGKGVSLTVEIPLPNPQNETGSQTADRG